MKRLQTTNARVINNLNHSCKSDEVPAPATRCGREQEMDHRIILPLIGHYPKSMSNWSLADGKVESLKLLVLQKNSKIVKKNIKRSKSLQ